MVDFVSLVINQGFAIAVAIFLLLERQRYNEKIVSNLEKIALIIEERIPKEEKTNGV